MNIITSAADKAKKAYAPLERLPESIHFTRDIVSEPANVIHPETLAAECKKLEKLGVKVEVLAKRK